MLAHTARQQVVTAREAAVANLAEARRFVHDWAPPDLESSSLRQALAQLSERSTASSGIPVDLTVSGTAVPLPTGHESALLRIAQQAVANAIQHADAHQIHLTLSYMDTEIALDAVDDGRGFDGADRTDRTTVDTRASRRRTTTATARGASGWQRCVPAPPP